MQRLLKLSLNTLLNSGFNVLFYIILSFIFSENISQVFTITYPIQSLLLILKSIFATGANITKYKEDIKDADDTGITIGIIVGLILCILVIINLKNYKLFMNINDNSLNNFIIFSIILIFLQYIFSLILEKLYFQHKEQIANFYTVIFNVVVFIVLILSSLIFYNEIITIVITLFTATILIIYLFVQTANISFYNFNIYKFIKYDSTSAFSHLLFFITYFIGLSNTFSFGNTYTLAMSFFTLLTDVQWDIFYNVRTLAKVDISQGKFNYISHKKNALILSIILDISIIVLSLLIYPFYKPNLYIVLIFTIPTLIDFLVVPFYELKKYYLHINYSPLKITILVQISNILRTLCSFLPTPYCTLIGQEITIYLQLICIYFIFKKIYIIKKDGIILKKL